MPPTDGGPPTAESLDPDDLMTELESAESERTAVVDILNDVEAASDPGTDEASDRSGEASIESDQNGTEQGTGELQERRQ